MTDDSREHDALELALREIEALRADLDHLAHQADRRETRLRGELANALRHAEAWERTARLVYAAMKETPNAARRPDQS